MKKAQPVSVDQVAAWLDQHLQTRMIEDASLNGLQIQGQRPVHRIALAVDASLESFIAAREEKADLLIVHHGLFWGAGMRWVGPHYERIKVLLDSGMGLYASHLPLDRHAQWGHNAVIAQKLGLGHRVPFGMYHGVSIGQAGVLSKPLALDRLSQQLGRVTGTPPRLLPFGPRTARKVAVVSGGGGDCAAEAKEKGYDTFVTGEISHALYHPLKEMKLNVVLGGHYATETTGLKALGPRLEKTFSCQSIFIDLPTGF